MGADLSMASRSFMPRPDKVYWTTKDDEQVLVIERDTFPSGYRVLYCGKIDGAESLLSAFGIKVPPKPPKPRYDLANFKGSSETWHRASIVVLMEDGKPFGTVLKNRYEGSPPLIRIVTKEDFKN